MLTRVSFPSWVTSTTMSVIQ